MSAKLTTHILDLTTGRPAAGMRVALYDRTLDILVKTVTTNTDGRSECPLLAGDEVKAHEYELLFHVGDYYRDAGFLNLVPIRFHIADATASYHVPLLCTPWAYSTYRGS